jgi:protein PET117
VAVIGVRNSNWPVRLLSSSHSPDCPYPPIAVDMTRAAKGTLIASCIISSLIIWGVHFQQNQEREVRDNSNLQLPHLTNLVKTMYQGVLRDDERRREKMKKRQEDLQESLRKREEYERVQSVTSATQTESV